MGQGYSGRNIAAGRSNGGGSVISAEIGVNRDNAIRAYITQPGTYEWYKQQFLNGDIDRVPVAAIEAQVRREKEAYDRLVETGGPLPPAYLEYGEPGSKYAQWNAVELRLRRKYGLPVRTIEQQR